MKMSNRTKKNAAWIAVGVLLAGGGAIARAWLLAVLGAALVAFAWGGLKAEWGR